ncbi:NADH-quinone oxidoreductase subunit NuoG [Pelagibacteraceae bacterium]|nr:NADH-quinone oxidoreductase subunit NuoG [Pelagibacteraceae bacterium]
MPKLKVNNIEVEVEDGLTVLQACEKAGVEIPRFCYHEKLSIAGNCRMCLVEMEKSPKPVASCAMPAAEGMNIKTNTEFVEKARKGVMEFLLANHPLDCPVCDQGGECDLQDQSMFYGVDKSRFKENKRQVPEKNMGPLIKTQMTRCIHCTRCVRFATEIAGVPEIGAIGRGEDMQITTYLEQSMQSELSANVVDLCPVGALTSKPYVFEARPWELKKTESIDVMDAIGSNIRVDTYGWEVKRILPRINEDINEEWISDKTRHACDGLLNQRLDTPYIKYNGKFEKASWSEVFNIIKSKFKNTDKEKICGLTGDLVNMETLYIFKEFFNKTLGSQNIESRDNYSYLNPEKRENYLFNSSINGIEEADFIFLLGTNPRFEATILNARIRKSYLQNKTKIISLNEMGDLTFPYQSLDGNTETVKKIIEGKHEVSDLIKQAKKPMIIMGQSALKSKSSKYIFESMKQFLEENDKLSIDWNALNVISENASTVGAFDLGIYKTTTGDNEVLKDLKDNKFEIIYLLGLDSINFEKKNEFIIYQGSHGDKGAEIADIILPGATYTEQNGYFTNLEGKLQKAYKASYPPELAKEDWVIINELAESMNHRKLFNDKDELDSSLINQINLHVEKDNSLTSSKVKELIF